MSQGLLIFPNVRAALDAGFTIDSVHADSEGMLPASITYPDGRKARALVRVA